MYSEENLVIGSKALNSALITRAKIIQKNRGSIIMQDTENRDCNIAEFLIIRDWLKLIDRGRHTQAQQ